MDCLCEYIILTSDYNIDDYIYYSISSINEFINLDNCIDIICKSLDIHKNQILINKDNLFKNRLPVISFTFKNRKCNFYEHYTTQQDFLCISIMPVE